jgi:RimJ/RimL family protein N-acetyltransferase
MTSSETDRYIIRPMTRGEIDLAVDWAAAEGWNPGLHDAESFHAADAEGFLVGLLDDEPIACISVVRYEDTFGFLGFYIARPEFRGQGYGWRIWQAGMERLADRIVGLDGVVAQQENYRKSGFVLAYRNLRHEGKAVGPAELPAAVQRVGRAT